MEIQVRHPISKMLGTETILDLGIFKFWNMYIHIMRSLAHRAQSKHEVHPCFSDTYTRRLEVLCTVFLHCRILTATPHGRSDVGFSTRAILLALNAVLILECFRFQVRNVRPGPANPLRVLSAAPDSPCSTRRNCCYFCRHIQ